MSRPKQFDRDAVLHLAMLLFWRKGYEATSTEDLVKAMGIGRQSMYDTFGDKHAIFLEALERYVRTEVGGLQHALSGAASPLQAIEGILFSVSAERHEERRRGCLLMNSTIECAEGDADVRKVVTSSARRIETEFQRAVERAQTLGELPARVDARAAGRFLFATLQGLRAAAKSDAPPAALRDIAHLALRGIEASAS